GLPPNLTIEDIVWSPDGNRLAFRVDAINPNEQNAINSGVWVYEPGSNRSWQVFRNTYQGQVEQLHQQQQALAIQWSPDGGGLVIAVTTPFGFANVVMSTFRDINQPSMNAPIEPIPYAFATWTADSTALIVSGLKWNEMTVIGRVAMNESRTYTPYLAQATSGLITQATIELYDGRIAFLGGPLPGAFALYVMWPGAPPVQISGTLSGQILSAEWNRERSAVLVTVQTSAGHRLWLVRTDGTTQDITPAAGFPAAVHWR
ncbi:MAG: PD40 domain-containing protein, partial [Anaerolineae bacterium]|nr:PD40 domain-containing protein [Anaerolineae bacterium]